ncbi:MAG: acyl-CoA synthetase [Proteobacteria bacterium]|nr:acyl-CoA synthetase [Pseudomonadota bacterium]
MPTRRKPVIAVVGNGSLPLDSPALTMAEELGLALVDRGYRVLTGGMGGVMEAASRGAHGSAHYSPGDTIGFLPRSEPTTANPWVDIVLPTGLGHYRNGLVAHSSAVVAVGGGAGTLSEMAQAWIYDRLIVALRVEGWSGHLADQALDRRIRFPDIGEDRVYGADNAEEAAHLIDHWLPKYRR